MKTDIDWVSATFDAAYLRFFRDEFSKSVAVGSVAVDRRKGFLGFAFSNDFFLSAHGDSFKVARLAFGGHHQNGRALIQISGSGLRFCDLDSLHSLLQKVEARLTRVDVALDTLSPAHGVDAAVELYKSGAFQGGGLPPTSTVAGDWLDGIKGRTLYVGSRTSAKMLRVYEKGKQLGVESEWVRWEVQFNAAKRVIPLDILLRPDDFFTGAYAFIADFFDFASRGEKIPTMVKAQPSIERAIYHMRRSYGRTLCFISDGLQGKNDDIISLIGRSGLPGWYDPHYRDDYFNFLRKTIC